MSGDKHDPRCHLTECALDHSELIEHDRFCIGCERSCQCALIAEVRAAGLEEAAKAVEQWRSFTNDMNQQNLRATFAELIRARAGVPESTERQDN